LDALLDDSPPARRDLVDILGGAVIMQARALSSYMKLAGAVTLSGVMVALVGSFIAHGPYVSSSVIRVADPAGERSVDPVLPDRVNMAWQDVMSRFSLSGIILQKKLYQAERNRQPYEDVIDEMRRNIRIERIAAPPDRPAGTADFRISFTYSDRATVADVTQALTSKLVNRYAKGDDIGNPVIGNTPPASLPPDRQRFWNLGLRTGLLLGILIASLRWRTKYTLAIVGFGLAGMIATHLLYFKYTGYLPGHYTSDARVRITPYNSDGFPQLMTDTEMSDWLLKTEEQTLTDERLSEIVQRPTLNLYPKEREKMPLDKVIATMRKNLSIQPVKSRSSLAISFTYPDRFKAQQVVAAICGELAGAFATRQKYRAMVAASKSTHWSKDGTVLGCAIAGGWDYECINNMLVWLNSTSVARHGSSLDVMDPASLPEHAIPSVGSLMLTGMALSMLFGALLLRKRHPVIA
jgi:hypothetical protein